MPTNEAANPTQWTILSSDLFDENSEDLEFPSNEESSAWSTNSSSSSCWSIISGDHKIIAKGCAQNAAKEARVAKERGDCTAKEWEAHAAEEQEAHAAKEQDVSAAQQHANNNKDPDPEDGAGQDDDERCKQEQKTPQFHRKWTYTDFMINVHRQEVGEVATQLSGARPGLVAYISSYRKALQIVEERLDDKTHAKYQAEAKKWTEQKPPPQVQQQMFNKHGQSTLWEFSKMMHSQYGARVTVLVGYLDHEHKPVITLYDNNDKLGSTSFKDHCKQWQNELFVDDFSKWTSESFGVQPSNSSQENGKKDLAVNIKLQKDS
ncbi:hypothetical protein V8E53_013505 [Lactarius tabidus]